MALTSLEWLAFLAVIGKLVCSTFLLTPLTCTGCTPGQSMSSPASMVSKVSPSDIGVRGGAITIEGVGFSRDVFNQFDPVLGNKVDQIAPCL